MRSSSSILVIVAAGLTLAGCNTSAPTEDACLPENDCVPPTAAELAPPLTPTGPPVEIAPESDPIRLQAQRPCR